MDKVLEAIRQTAVNMDKERATLEESLKANLRVRVTDEDLPEGVDRLIYNHCLNKTQLANQLKITRPTLAKKLAEAEEAGVIGDHTDHGLQHLYTNKQVHALMDFFGMPTYSDYHSAMMTCIINHKGGTGKSSTTVALATATALDLDLNARVLVVDLDPQGSAGQGVLQISDDSIFVTMADILLAEFEPENQENMVNVLLSEGYSLEEIIQNCAFSTHLNNLSMITAFPNDERFVDVYWQLDKPNRDKLLRKFSDVVLPCLKEIFDVIYVDMPPQDSPITWSAIEATDMVLVPVTPRHYDYASTTNFMHNLSERLPQLPSQGKNVKWCKIAAVNYQETSKPEYETFQKLMRSARSNMLTATIEHSDAFTASAQMGRTVLDVKKSERICSDKQFDIAVNSVNTFYKQFRNELIQVAVK